MPSAVSPRSGIAFLAATAIFVALSPASATAATVTVGSQGNEGLSGYIGNNGSAVTVANLALADPAAHVSSPVDGTVVRWRIVTLGTGPYSLRILRPSGGGQYAGAGTSTQSVAASGSYTFEASLPIKAGDVIGVDLPDNQGIGGSSQPGARWSLWVPPVAQGSPASPIDAFTEVELAFSADVQYSGGPAKKKCKKKKPKRSGAAAKKKKCKKKRKKA